MSKRCFSIANSTRPQALSENCECGTPKKAMLTCSFIFPVKEMATKVRLFSYYCPHPQLWP